MKTIKYWEVYARGLDRACPIANFENYEEALKFKVNPSDSINIQYGLDIQERSITFFDTAEEANSNADQRKLKQLLNKLSKTDRELLKTNLDQL